MGDVFGGFGDKAILDIKSALKEVRKEHRHVGCLVDLDDKGCPRVKVFVLSWADRGCIISARVAKNISKIVSRATGIEYVWRGTGECTEIIQG